MRPIDADALIKRIDTLKHRIAMPAAGFVSEDSYECGALDGLTDAQNYAKEAETVEAIPVVRCRDCKHCFNMDSDPLEPYDGESEWYCEAFDVEWNVMRLDPNRFYCANGERREE